MSGQNQERVVADFGLYMIKDQGVVCGIQQTLPALEVKVVHAAAWITTQSDACGLWRDGEPIPDGHFW